MVTPVFSDVKSDLFPVALLVFTALQEALRAGEWGVESSMPLQAREEAVEEAKAPRAAGHRSGVALHPSRRTLTRRHTLGRSGPWLEVRSIRSSS